MEMILENMLESVNEYCEEINHEFVLSKPGEIIEYCDNGFVVSNDTERMIFTNPKSLSNFTKYSTELEHHYLTSCIYNENNRKFISTSIFDIIASLLRALDSMETLAYNYIHDDDIEKYYKEVVHVIEDDFNSYMDSALINILDFAEIDIDVPYFKFSDDDDIYDHFKKDFKTLCKLFMVMGNYVDDAAMYAFRVCKYWAKDNDKFMDFIYSFIDFLEEEVIPELEQEFNITQ